MMYLLAIATLQKIAKDSVYQPTNSNWTTGIAYAGQLLFVVVAFIFVLLLAYFSTKWIASLKHIHGSNRNVQIVESISIGNQSHIHLIKAGKKYLLVGGTKENISTLAEINPEDIIEKENPQFMAKMPFDKIMQQILQKKNG